jgi:hypothetical protein
MEKEFNYYRIRDKYPEKSFMGIRDGKRMYLIQPSWYCDWYWGFGYLQSAEEHRHVSSIVKESGKNFRDALVDYFGDSFAIRTSDIWKFAELFKTFYALKETAEVLGRGGSHLTTNPCAEIIKNPDEVTRINQVVIPAIFEAIYEIIERNKDNKKKFNRIVELAVEGDTLEIVKFMMKHWIAPMDINGMEGITKHDYNVIHSKYYEVFHSQGIIEE